MRSKIIILLSIIVLLVVCIFVYKNITGKSIDDYIEDTESAFKTTVDNYSFYAEEVTDNEAVDISNMMSLLGVSENAIVSESNISSEGTHFSRDIILMYTDDIDYTKLLYSIVDSNNEYYYVWTDTSGSLRGMHLDKDFQLIELR